MGVDIRHHKVHPSSTSSLSASCAIHMPIGPRIPVPHQYIPTIAQFPESFVHLSLYKRRGTAGAGAEIDEGVVGDGWAEDSLERAGDEGGGGRRLQDWGFVFPEEGETCLDEGAEGSGKPGFGLVVLVVFVGGDGMGWCGGSVPGLIVDFEETEWRNG